MEEARDALRREASLARQKSDASRDDDGAPDADAVFSKRRGGKSGKSGKSPKSGKSGKSGVSFLSMRSLERERHQEKKLAAALPSPATSPPTSRRRARRA